MIFPADPTDGTLFEYEPGVLYQFDATLNSWILVSNHPDSLGLATTTTDGLMSSDDYKKLSGLLVPPPIATINAGCSTPYDNGTIALYSGDDFIKISGSADIQNTDEYGDKISKTIPSQIHQHSFSFDFGININELKNELIRRGQFNVIGDKGDKGEQGDTGEDGESDVKTGPKGDKGDQGTAPPSTLRIEPEIVPSEPRYDLDKVLTGNIRVEVDACDSSKFKLVFERKTAGRNDATTSLFNVKDVHSDWILVVENLNNIPQKAYYIDASVIVESIHQKFLSEVQRIKTGYENITAFWIQQMSDLFDEQKAALCCALEFCISKTKSTAARQHMESVAAASAGKAKIIINNRNSAEAVQQSSTRLLKDLGHQDTCAAGPVFPAPLTSETESQSLSAQSAKPINDNHIIKKSSLAPIINIGDNALLIIGSNNNQLNAYKLQLNNGKYIITINDINYNINNKYLNNIKVSYNYRDSKKHISFLNKGAYDAIDDAVDAYVGLSLSFDHYGGEISIYHNISPGETAFGDVELTLVKIDEISNDYCIMQSEHLQWYSNEWDNGKCCGLITDIDGQEFIIIKKSESCGGGSIPALQCSSKFDGSAIAWPTFDGQTFAPIPNSDITFVYDTKLSSQAINNINEDVYHDNTNHGKRKLQHELNIILFPTNS